MSKIVGDQKKSSAVSKTLEQMNVIWQRRGRADNSIRWVCGAKIVRHSGQSLMNAIGWALCAEHGVKLLIRFCDVGLYGIHRPR